MSSWQQSMREASPYLSLGTQLALSMVLFVGGGFALDRYLDSLPWLTLVGALLGMTSMVVRLVRVARDGISGPKKRKNFDP